ncbi:hypothetical protein JCM10908_001284 [Rhodotorula pacifica]|uniref:uncharacterized protein n=1 Tax=Rhodotorula pacifica TaxID=1495444 RepID=UPI00317D6565
MPVADHGQWDTLEQQSEAERRNPHFRLITPEGYGGLYNSHDHLIHHPPHPRDLQQTLQDLIPTLDDLYNEYPETTSLFLVNELLARVPDATDDPAVPRQQLEYMLLMCLHRDPPANQPVQSPTAPPGPTVNYVDDRDSWLQLLADRLVYGTECARVCVSDGLRGRSQRFDQAGPGQPTARMFQSMAMIVSIELASIVTHLHVDIASVVLKGKWAIEVANLLPKICRVELVPKVRNSRTFDGEATTDYHPRLPMTSNHRPVRSLPLLRECLRDELDGVNRIGAWQLRAVEIYHLRAGSLHVDVEPWQNIYNELGLDINDPASAFDVVSRALQEYVREFGTGTHGGGAGPNVYVNYPRSKGGGCALRRTRKRVPASEKGLGASNPQLEDKELDLSEVLEGNQIEVMAELLTTGGESSFKLSFSIEGFDKAALRSCFEAAMPCLELSDRLTRLEDSSGSAPITSDHPALLCPTIAEQVLDLLESDLPHAELESRIAEIVEQAMPAANPPLDERFARSARSRRSARRQEGQSLAEVIDVAPSNEPSLPGDEDSDGATEKIVGSKQSSPSGKGSDEQPCPVARMHERLNSENNRTADVLMVESSSSLSPAAPDAWTSVHDNPTATALSTKRSAEATAVKASTKRARHDGPLDVLHASLPHVNGEVKAGAVRGDEEWEEQGFDNDVSRVVSSGLQRQHAPTAQEQREPEGHGQAWRTAKTALRERRPALAAPPRPLGSSSSSDYPFSSATWHPQRRSPPPHPFALPDTGPPRVDSAAPTSAPRRRELIGGPGGARAGLDGSPLPDDLSALPMHSPSFSSNPPENRVSASGEGAALSSSSAAGSLAGRGTLAPSSPTASSMPDSSRSTKQSRSDEDGLSGSIFGPDYPQPRAQDDLAAFKGTITST